MSNYKLTYFNLRARGENSRMLFALAGQKYEDNRIERENWPQLKPKSPFGQLPLLEVDGETFCQSHAIERFLAKRLGLYGDSDVEQAKADMVVDCIEDMGKPFTEIFFAPEDKKDALRKKYTSEQAPAFLANLNKMVNDNGFFTGNKISWPEIAFYNGAAFTTAIGVDVSAEMKKCPKLQGVLDKVSKDAKLAEWIKNRPQTPF